MKIIAFMLLVAFSFNTYSQTVKLPDGINVTQKDANNALTEMFKSMKMDKKQFATVLDMLVAKKQISKAEADKAKKELESMSDSEYEKFKASILQMAISQTSTLNLPKGQ